MKKKQSLLQLTKSDRRKLERMVEDENQTRVGDRAFIILKTADGYTSHELETEFEMSGNTIDLWRRRFREGGVSALKQDAPRSGRPRKLPGATRGEIKAALAANKKMKTGRRSIRELTAELNAAKLNVSHMLVWRLSQT